jgi:hypothetical protein
MGQETNLDAILAASGSMDWQQVVSNGGPPCFHVETDGHFCGRAKRWGGHNCMHDYVSLADLVQKIKES